MSEPEALNGWIFESKSVTPAVLIVIGSMVGILCSFNVGKCEISSAVWTDEKR